MTALPLEDHSLYEREQLARINTTPAAPESFDPIAALRRVAEIADQYASHARALHASGLDGAEVFDGVTTDLRLALTPQALR